jgi:tryptophan 2,3-dioxygenase
MAPTSGARSFAADVTPAGRAMTAQLEARSASPEQNHYWRYHRLFDLLACKQPLTNSMDEDLFIAVHQVCELGFHQMILDLDRALKALADLRVDTSAAEEASYFLERVVALYGTVNGTVPLLAELRGFVEFRQALGPGSVFQSFQFRRLEIMSGIADAHWRDDESGKPLASEAPFERSFGVLVDGWLRTYRHHSLRHHYEDLLARTPGVTRAARLATLREQPALHRLLGLLKAYDEARMDFQRLHMAVAARQLAPVGNAPALSFRSPAEPRYDNPAALFDGLHAATPATGKAA